jgi:porin
MARIPILILLSTFTMFVALSQESAKQSADRTSVDGRSVLTIAENDPKAASKAVAEPRRAPEPGSEVQEQRQGISTLWHAWDGMRTSLGEHGLDVAVTYKSDNLSTVSGGLGRGSAYIQNIDLTASLDAQKVLGLSGTKMFVHVLSNNGGGLNRYVGDIQMVSNLEGFALLKLYQCWGEYEFSDRDGSVRAGLYDLNSEFYVTASSGLFLNASHGIGREFSQAGLNGPSIFPNTGLALRVKLQPWQNVFTQIVALDGRPGTEEDPVATSFRIDSREGALLVAECGYLRASSDEEPGLEKLAVGVWQYTASFEEILPGEAGETISSSRNGGMYVIAEKKFMTGESGNPRSVSFFVRGGVANSRINRFQYHYGFGIVSAGLFSGRADDVFGVAVAHARGGDAYCNLKLMQGEAVRSGETTIEVTYRAQIAPWIAVQPNIQFVSRPGEGAGNRDATVVGARIEVGL